MGDSIIESMRELKGDIQGWRDRQERKFQQMQKQLDSIDASGFHHSGGYGGPDGGPDQLKTAFEESPGYAAFLETGRGKFAVKVADRRSIEAKATILTGDTVGMVGTAGVGMPARLGGVVPLAQRRLYLRDLLFRGNTTEAPAVYFVRELTFDNEASPQFSEGSYKNQSSETFQAVAQPVVTLAHFEMASRQVLSDLPALVDFIRTKMTYGLKYVEEQEILAGDGQQSHLEGLITVGDAFNTSLLGSSWTRADVLRRALQQVQEADEAPVGFFVVHPRDWAAIALTKNSLGDYITAQPGGNSDGPAMLWGCPVVVSTAITAGTWLAGSSSSAELVDRMAITIEVSFESQDNFVRNLATLLCEERTTLLTYRPHAFVHGSFSTSPSS
jgi:HK97 family phage major capsid protein